MAVWHRDVGISFRAWHMWVIGTIEYIVCRCDCECECVNNVKYWQHGHLFRCARKGSGMREWMEGKMDIGEESKNNYAAIYCWQPIWIKMLKKRRVTHSYFWFLKGEQWIAQDKQSPINVRIAKLFVTSLTPTFASVASVASVVYMCCFLISLVYNLTRRLSEGSSPAPTCVCVIVYFQKHQYWAYLPWASINVETYAVFHAAAHQCFRCTFWQMHNVMLARLLSSHRTKNRRYVVFICWNCPLTVAVKINKGWL